MDAAISAATFLEGKSLAYSILSDSIQVCQSIQTVLYSTPAKEQSSISMARSAFTLGDFTVSASLISEFQE